MSERPKSSADTQPVAAKATPGPWMSDLDRHLFQEGAYYRSFDRLGAHIVTRADGTTGVQFTVWAPNARSVSVIGDFNSWKDSAHPLSSSDTGVWTGFISGVTQGASYKYSIISRESDHPIQKSDPYGFYFEVAPRSGSVVWSLDGYEWQDQEWIVARSRKNNLAAPISIYEVHLGSWRRKPEEGGRFLTYRESAEYLAQYVADMGFTHVELLPIMEYPFDGSWGYQTIGYFAPTSRFGTPQEFMYLVDTLHRHGIGVILDWVPGHFPTDGHGLGLFDGTHLYEHADPRQGFHEDWGTYIFNFGRHEVSNFLISSALFWLEKYHIDGLRVDAVASILYNDYSRKEGEWIPNKYGGRENLEGIQFLRRLNEVVYSKIPDSMMCAEESTAWPMVSRPTYVGGLGFGYKWNMGWMNDVLSYMSKEPIFRSYHHNNLTFGLLYAFHENFILPFSHDEVVHGKQSMLAKMPGDVWQKFANLRALYGFMYGHPGKKLLFMGSEFGQWREWDHETSIDWNLLDYPFHGGVRLWLKDLNSLLRSEPCLHAVDFEGQGFQWTDCNDSSQSVLSFVRRSKEQEHQVLCIYNFTPVPRYNYRVGVSQEGYWEEVLNSDASVYGGSGLGNSGGLFTEYEPAHGHQSSLNLLLPPLSALLLRPLRTS